MDHDQRNTPAASSPECTPIAELAAYRHHRDSRCGKSYKFMPAAVWRATYSPRKVFQAVATLEADEETPSRRGASWSDAWRQPGGSRAVYDLGRTERAVLYLLMAWPHDGLAASPKDIGRALGIPRQDARRVLTRLGEAGVVVNTGSPRAQNLAINPRLEEWNLELVREKRRVEGALIRVRKAKRGKLAVRNSTPGPVSR